MSMNFNSVGGFYQKTVKGNVKASKAESSGLKNGVASLEVKAENADKVSISPDAAEKYEVYRLTQGVMKELGEIDNTQKIASLQESIKNNTYQIPTEQLAEKMVSRFVAE